MIVAWMLYTLVIGALIAGVTVVVEQLALRSGRPTRRAWVWGIAGTMGVPIAGMLFKDAPAAMEILGSVEAASHTSGAVMDGVNTLAVLDGAAGLAWALTSGVFAALLAGLLVSTWLRHRRWPAADIDGVPVLLSDDVGPAVVGVFRSRIVLPAWALEAPAGERTMMLRHEQEHVRAGDQKLLLFAALALIVIPWNAVAWFMVHRLRLAIEVDCDRRVMHAGDLDPRSYAELLLAVGLRRSAPAYAVGFSLGRPFLEQRIDRMTLRAPGVTRTARALALVMILGVMCAAWTLPQPIRAARVGTHWGGACPIADEIEMTRGLLRASEWST